MVWRAAARSRRTGCPAREPVAIMPGIEAEAYPAKRGNCSATPDRIHGVRTLPNLRASPMAPAAVTAEIGTTGSPAARSAVTVQVLQRLQQVYFSRAT